MPKFVEEGVNAMSLFSNDQTVIDQASAVDRGTCKERRGASHFLYFIKSAKLQATLRYLLFLFPHVESHHALFSQ